MEVNERSLTDRQADLEGPEEKTQRCPTPSVSHGRDCEPNVGDLRVFKEESERQKKGNHQPGRRKNPGIIVYASQRMGGGTTYLVTGAIHELASAVT